MSQPLDQYKKYEPMARAYLSKEMGADAFYNLSGWLDGTIYRICSYMHDCYDKKLLSNHHLYNAIRRMIDRYHKEERRIRFDMNTKVIHGSRSLEHPTWQRIIELSENPELIDGPPPLDENDFENPTWQRVLELSENPDMIKDIPLYLDDE